MLVSPRLVTRAAVLVAFLAASVSLSVVPHAVAVTSHRPLNDTRPVGSAPVSVDFPIEYFGLVADLRSRTARLTDQGRAPYGQARFRVDGHWTPWRALEQDGAQEPGHFTGALVSVDRADAYQVRGLPDGAHNWRAAAINTTDGHTVVVGERRSGAASGAPTCLSRADWGADESISGWAKGDTQSYYPVQAMTVHHSAGSNDLSQDYAATVRAIYSYHVQTNGWADIGYQYLVDGHGTLYEGRSSGQTSTSCLYDGGDGSDFAHQTSTDHVVTGAHVGGYNAGNVGIAVMGCYEPTSACSGDTQPPSAAVAALESVVASLSTRHGLDPNGEVHYVNPVTGAATDVPTVSGHRDWGNTECLGGNLYAQLPAIRTNVVAFQQATRTVAENVGSAQLRVTRSGNTNLPGSVTYAPTSGTAQPDVDFSLAPGTLTFAAGETTKTIPMTITNDVAREAGETIVVSLGNPGAGTVLGPPASMTVIIAASDQQPDAWISSAPASGYAGNNIYNTTGYNQTKTLKAQRTQARMFYVRVYNDGNVSQAFALRGSAARVGSAVRYYSGTTNITTAMRSAAGWNVQLKPGTFTLVKVQIKLLRTAALGSYKPATVRGTWIGDGTRADLVKAAVKVIR